LRVASVEVDGRCYAVLQSRTDHPSSGKVLGYGFSFFLTLAMRLRFW
jgi:hypothetical protein